MKKRNGKCTSAVNVLWMFAMAAIFLAVVTNAAKAKSLYVIADIQGTSTDRTEPVHAYDIGVDGALTFQAQHDIPHRMLGAVGMAIDSDSGYVFITYEASGQIQLVDGTTMTDAGRVGAADALDLAGIVYDHARKLLYCVDRGRAKLYVYDWDAKTPRLTRATGSPFTLWGDVDAYGIALDEIDGLLYVASASKTINVYSTSDWSRVKQIELSRVAISVAVDVMNGFLYTGGGYAGNNYLTQYHLATGVEAEVQVEPDGGVMGLGVDSDTGLVYMSTGRNNAPGGDNLLVYDSELNQISKTHVGGNPTGLAIPGKDIGFNPLNLTKELIRGSADNGAPGDMPFVGAGKTITYGIGFSNLGNDFTVTDVTVVDTLSHDVTFVSADTKVTSCDSVSTTVTS
ncbi:MAG: YncE family protein, partial [Planctomycetota bacterium]